MTMMIVAVDMITMMVNAVVGMNIITKMGVVANTSIITVRTVHVMKKMILNVIADGIIKSRILYRKRDF